MVDLGAVVRQHSKWTKNLPRVVSGINGGVDGDDDDDDGGGYDKREGRICVS